MDKTLPQTTSACLADFILLLSEYNRGYINYVRAADFMDLVQVVPSTLRRWRVDSSIPSGANLVTLRYFLEHVGYTVSELEGLDDQVRKGIELIALRIFCPDALAATIGQSARYTLQVLSAVRKPSPEFAESFVREHERHSELIAKRRQNFIEKVQQYKVDSARHSDNGYKRSSLIVAPAIVPKEIDEHDQLDTLAKSLAHLLQAVTLLGTQLLRDKKALHARQKVRTLCTAETMAEAARIVSALCCERAGELSGF